MSHQNPNNNNFVPSQRTESEEAEADEDYQVVLDIEDRYSIWPTNKKIPPLWRPEGFSGKKKECLDYIQKVWTDMRPKSLKIQMQAWEDEKKKTGEPWKLPPEELEKLKKKLKEEEKEGFNYFHMPQPPDDLIKRLMKKQPIEIIRYKASKDAPLPDLRRFTDALQRGYVLVKFPWTQGGTELGLSLDTKARGQPEPGWLNWKVEGKVSFRGRLKLNFTPIMVFCEIDLKTWKGTGYVEVCPWWKSPQMFRDEEKQQAEERGQKRNEN